MFNSPPLPPTVHSIIAQKSDFLSSQLTTQWEILPKAGEKLEFVVQYGCPVYQQQVEGVQLSFSYTYPPHCPVSGCIHTMSGATAKGSRIVR